MSTSKTAATGLALFLALTTGCTSTQGPDLVVNSHLDYNKAVRQVLQEELLLNIVRRRYMESPQFLTVSSISTNFTTTGRTGASASVGDWGDANIVDAGVDGSVTFEDSPTITLTPRQGEDMASQLAQPVSVSTVTDLVAAGYPIESVLLILVEGINNLRSGEITFEGFRVSPPDWKEAVALIGKLQRSGELIADRFRWNDPYGSKAYPADAITPEMWITTISTGARRWKSTDGGETYVYTSHEMAPAFWLDPAARQTADGQRLMELLNVQPDVQKKIWILEPARVPEGADLEGQPDVPRPTLKLNMRSLYKVLNVFSWGVEVPPADEEEGRSTDLREFRSFLDKADLGELGKYRVRYSRERPESAYQVVEYRGLWFYIDDADLVSKTAFNALYDLWQLSVAAPSSPSTPVTTIQVN